MNFTQLRAFHALARTGRFTLAADYLRVSQPAITAQIKALEGHYQVTLFERRGHDLALTEIGQNLYDLSRQIMSDFETARSVLDHESKRLTGSLVVAADNPTAVMPVMASLRNKYPDLHVSLEIANSQTTLRHLLEYEADVALAALDAPADELHTEPILEWHLSILVATSHPWIRRRTLRVRELAGRPMVVREQDSLTRRLLEDLLQRHAIDVERVLELRQQGAVRDAVASGLGIGVELTGDGVSDYRLHSLELRDDSVVGVSVAACRSERRRQRKIAAFFETAKEIEPKWPIN